MTTDTIQTLTSATTTLLAHDHWDGPAWWWPVFPLVWLLVLATIVTFVVRRGRRYGWDSGRHAGERRLAERYAAGEIDDTEYFRRLDVLRGGGR
jgi:putative membrane protein